MGIANCLKRFKFYYNGMGEINFSNSPLGGAIVDIHIPYQRYEQERNGYKNEVADGR